MTKSRSSLAYRRRPFDEADRAKLWRWRKSLGWSIERIRKRLDRTGESCRQELARLEQMEQDTIRERLDRNRADRVAQRREKFRRDISDERFWDNVDDQVAEKAGGFLPPKEDARKRLRADVILKLYNQKSITKAEHDAALSIRDVVYAIGRGLFPMRALEDLGTYIDGGAPYRDPLNRMNKAEYDTWLKVYVPWSTAMGRAPVGQSGRYLLELIHDIAIDNWGPRQADKAYRIGNGRSLEYLRQGLEDYAKRAGFISKGRAA
ncbi:MAG: hypothetical protein RIA64_01370 [Rhodospirillales bacterium]